MGKQIVTLMRISHELRYAEDGEKEYRKCSVQTKEVTNELDGKPRWIGGWASEETYAWRLGDKVELTIVEEGKYLNFKAPTAEELRLAKENAELKAQIAKQDPAYEPDAEPKPADAMDPDDEPKPAPTEEAKANHDVDLPF